MLPPVAEPSCGSLSQRYCAGCGVSSSNAWRLTCVAAGGQACTVSTCALLPAASPSPRSSGWHSMGDCVLCRSCCGCWSAYCTRVLASRLRQQQGGRVLAAACYFCWHHPLLQCANSQETTFCKMVHRSFTLSMVLLLQLLSQLLSSPMHQRHVTLDQQNNT